MESYKSLITRAMHGSDKARAELARREEEYIHTGLVGIHGEDVVYRVTETVDELVGYISKAHINNSRSYSEVILLDAYGSATIEGARTTVERVRCSIKNPVTKDDRMVVNVIKAQNYVYNNGISPGNIRYVWEMLTEGVCENTNIKGVKWRSGMVYIGSATEIVHRPEEPKNIGEKMDGLFRFCGETLDEVVKACIVHFYFVYVHPFCDGNGRMARLWMSWILSGYHKDFRYLVVSREINESLHEYYSSLSVAEFPYNGMMDITPFIEYMLQMIVNAIDFAGIQKYVKLDEIDKTIVSKVNKDGITVKRLVQVLNVPEWKVRGSLKKLVDSRMLGVDKCGKSYRYYKL